MKTTIEIIKCDECNQKIDSMEKCFTISIKYTNGSFMDLCWDCVQARVKHSFDVMPASQCKTCSGKGKVKVSVYNNDYEWETCKNCSGKGKVI